MKKHNPEQYAGKTFKMDGGHTFPWNYFTVTPDMEYQGTSYLPFTGETIDRIAGLRPSRGKKIASEQHKKFRLRRGSSLFPDHPCDPVTPEQTLAEKRFLDEMIEKYGVRITPTNIRKGIVLAMTITEENLSNMINPGEIYEGKILSVRNARKGEFSGEYTFVYKGSSFIR